MKTKGINTSEQIDSLKSNPELRMKSMMISCFAYGGIERGSYNYDTYIQPYFSELGQDLFEEVYADQYEFLKQCSIEHGVYTDYEGCCYNNLIYQK